MKKLYPLLFISVLICWGCEDKTDDNTPEEVDNTPTEVTLWGVVYSIEDTYTLDLSNSGLTGEIPPEIDNLTNLTELKLSNNQLTGYIPSQLGNLTNLTNFYLNDNQLTGQIPESICDLNIDWSNNNLFNITINQLCPPYPSCIEDYVGTQGTSDCD